MADLEIYTPAVIGLSNISGSNSATFLPYKENFKVAIPANTQLQIPAKTAGQVLYYYGQATKDISVEYLGEDFTLGPNGNGTGVVYIALPAIVSLENTGDRKVGFVPYMENFTTYLNAGDSIEITANTVGQVLYYLAQATDGLSVSQEPVDPSVIPPVE